MSTRISPPSSTRESLADRLRECSREAHRHAETRDLQALMVRGRLPLDQLVAYLVQLEAIHAALERAIDRLDPAEAAEIGWSDELRHSRRLRADLDGAGAERSERRLTPTCRRFARWLDDRSATDVESLLGVLYVLEGSMNGNRFIAGALAGAYGPGHSVGLSYFDPYGDSQRSRWTEFREGLDRFGGRREDHDRIESACLRTFAAIAAIAEEVPSVTDARTP